MNEETMIKMIDTELTNLNKLIYELKGDYDTGDPQLIYFQMRQRLEMLETAADWSRIIQSRLDNDEDYLPIAHDFVNFIVKKYGGENLMWFYHHIEVNSREVKTSIFRAIRAQLH
jgi:hypothetical protein